MDDVRLLKYGIPVTGGCACILLGSRRGIGSDSADNTHRGCPADFMYVRGIEEETH